MVKPAARDARWAAARCNDGTPFALTVAPTPASDTWVIKFPGGWYCNEGSVPCKGRSQKLTTTTPQADGEVFAWKRTGVVSPEEAVNPTFFDANHVELHYCSSDFWFGLSDERQPVRGIEGGWYFSGRLNLRVAVEVLVEQYGLDDANPETRVLVVGQSAGGGGQLVGTRDMAEVLPKTAAAGRMKGISDAWWGFRRTRNPTARSTRWGEAHDGCASGLQARGEDPVDCTLGQVWYPFVEEDGYEVLVQVSGQDLPQLKAWRLRGVEEREQWRTETLASVEGVEWLYTKGHPYHIATSGAEWKGGFREAVTQFWQGGPPRRWIEGYDTPVRPARGR